MLAVEVISLFKQFRGRYGSPLLHREFPRARREGAMAAFERERAQVIVSDIGMSVEDGYSFINRLHALPPEAGGTTPAASLTAYADIEDRRRALSAGFNMHVPKPIDPAELVTVSRSLGRFCRALR